MTFVPVMMGRHTFAIDEAPHVEADLPDAASPDRSVKLRCTICETEQTFDSEGITDEAVRERMVSFAMEHEACPLTGAPAARALAREVEEDEGVRTLARSFEAADVVSRGLASDCAGGVYDRFIEWTQAERRARALRAQLTAERVAVQRRILDGRALRRGLHEVVARMQDDVE